MNISKLIVNCNAKNLLKNTLNINQRGITSSSLLHGTFKVQDDKDFLEKVENSKEPVIVDFFAT